MHALRFKIKPEDFISKDDKISTTYISKDGTITKVFKETNNFHIDLRQTKIKKNGNNNNN